MKISKKDLRKIIFETVLREQAGDVQGTAAGARKTKVDADKSDILKSNIEKSVKQIVSKVAEKNSFRGMITIGKKRTEVTKAEPQELGKKIERALESDSVLKGYKESLKVSRAFKITVNKAQNSEPTADVDTKGEEEAKKTTDDWKAYEGETDWLYKIEGESPSQIWVTKKPGGGPEYELNKPKYEKTVKKLDAAAGLPDRTDASKAKDPALKKPAAKPAADQKAAAAPSQENPFERSDAEWRKETKSTYSDMPLPEIGNDDTFDLGNNSETTRNDALQDIINWLYTRDVVMGSGGDLEDMPEAERYNLSKAISITGDNFLDESEKAFADHKTKGPKDRAGGEEMAYPAVGRIIYATIEAFARINTAYNHSLNIKDEKGEALGESKVIYGKSHATLLRERYWGRY